METKALHELCDTLSEELEEYAQKTRNGLNAGDLDAIDKLSHALKSIKTTIAMIEADGYSGGYMPRMGTYVDGRGRSYAPRRDSMGRYSRNYSYADSMEDLLHEMREMLPGLSDEKRRKAEQLINELR